MRLGACEARVTGMAPVRYTGAIPQGAVYRAGASPLGPVYRPRAPALGPVYRPAHT